MNSTYAPGRAAARPHLPLAYIPPAKIAGAGGKGQDLATAVVVPAGSLPTQLPDRRPKLQGHGPPRCRRAACSSSRVCWPPATISMTAASLVDLEVADSMRSSVRGGPKRSEASYGHRVAVAYQWRGAVTGTEVEALHAEGFGHEPSNHLRWEAQLVAHSLGWVCARQDGRLVGFVNVAWDGSSHAFVLDTVVAQSQRGCGVGTDLVALAVREAQGPGCEWVHVDFDDDLSRFYFGACGFRPTSAGLLHLTGE